MTPTSSQPIELLAEGQSKYHPVNPDGFREWVRDHKSRALVSKLMTEKKRLIGSSRTAITSPTNATT